MGPSASKGSSTTLELELTDLAHIAQAVEAGPLLVEDGKVAIDMKAEGWKTENSIRTQAARFCTG